MSPLVTTFYFKDSTVVDIGNWVFRVIEYLGSFVPAGRDRRLASIFRHYCSIFLVIFYVMRRHHWENESSMDDYQLICKWVSYLFEKFVSMYGKLNNGNRNKLKEGS
jgi:hypothetical protein